MCVCACVYGGRRRYVYQSKNVLSHQHIYLNESTTIISGAVHAAQIRCVSGEQRTKYRTKFEK